MRSSDLTFIVELPSGVSDFEFRSTTIAPASPAFGAILQAIETRKPTSDTYWNDWGGTYDNPNTVFISLFIDRVLTRVDTLQDLILLPYSSLVVGTQLYFHIPHYLWQRENILSRIDYLQGYSSNVEDTNFPSFDKYKGVRYPVIMQIPSLALNLSDPVNGIFLSPTFQISLDNTDGRFDNQDSTTLLNNPVTVKKSTSRPATYDSFRNIRVGEIENVTMTMDSLVLSGADFLRTLGSPATRTISEAGLGPSGDSLPIAYGYPKSLPFIELSSVTTGDITVKRTVVIDPDYLSNIMQVRNSDGVSIKNYVLDNSTGIITFTIDSTIESNQEPIECDIIAYVGIVSERLGAIVMREIELKAGIPKTDSFWSLAEAENYSKLSPRLNFYFNGGTVESLVKQVLKNDMAYLIQQNDGRLTLRKWAQDYTTHGLKSWQITKKPKRSFSDFKYFYSSVVIEYSGGRYLNDSVESETIALWKKSHRGIFKTNLRSESLAMIFSESLLSRFAKRAQLWSVGTGEDTSGIELLDTVLLPMVVNDRKMSDFTKWKVIGINTAQDELILEEYEKLAPPEDGIPMSHPFIHYEPGYLAQPFIYYRDGYLSQNPLNR